MKKITTFAPAKLNLFLDVTSKRENGYHEIDSIMQSVDLCDEINVEISDGSGIEVICASDFAPAGKDNIIWRAADAYLTENKIDCSLKIELIKNIPSPAGMGGGSSDAASILRLLNDNFKAMDYQSLVSLGLKIGSDVPFCLRGGTQRVVGLGEVLSPIKDMPRSGIFLIAVSGEDVPTPGAYKRLDSIYDSFKEYKRSKTPDKIIAAVENFDLAEISSGMFNIFEEAVLPNCPKAAYAKKYMIESGALGAMMSGSGATVFGIFSDDDKDRVDHIKKMLEKEGTRVFVARTLPGDMA